MKVVTSNTMQDLDRRAMEEFGVSGLQLMENAGSSCSEEIFREFGRNGRKRAVILAGKGNNGGDGFVIARQLSQKGWDVKVCILAERARIEGAAGINLDKLPPQMASFCPAPGELSALLRDEIRHADVIVDALLGTGLRSDIGGVYLEAVELINSSGRPVLAVDIPSGVQGSTGKVLGDAVRADVTVTFAFAKLGHILYPGAEYVGRLVIADIGIPQKLMEAAPGYEFLDEEGLRPLLRRRDRQVHKGDCGHCLIIAGSTGKTGAAALCANSSVRAGSGLVTLAVPESLHHILEVKTTEAMTVPLPDSVSGHLADSAFSTIVELLNNKDVLAIGPGIGRRPGTVSLVQAIVEAVDLPMVIDADGLNALAEDTSVLQRKKSSTVILTPHPGEMSRLLGTSIPDGDASRITVAQEFARTYGVYLVLKGARTIIAGPSGIAAFNGSGNPGMASGGMGDVLTGIIASLLGQGYCAWDACRLGVFVHGYAGDMVAKDKGEIGISATDVQEKIPYAYARLSKTP